MLEAEQLICKSHSLNPKKLVILLKVFSTSSAIGYLCFSESNKQMLLQVSVLIGLSMQPNSYFHATYSSGSINSC